MAQGLEAAFFIDGELFWISRIKSGQKAVEQRVGDAVDGDGFVLEVDGLEQAAVVHLKVRISRRGLAFELELQDADGFLHPSDDEGITSADVAFGLPFQGRAVAVHVAGELLEGFEGDAVSFFELLRAPVAQGNAGDGAQQGLLPKARTHPTDVVVAPGDGQLGLPGEHVDDLVEARSSISQVTGHDELIHTEIAHHPRDQAQQLFGFAPHHKGLDEGAAVAVGVGAPARRKELAEHFFVGVGEHAFDGACAPRHRQDTTEGEQLFEHVQEEGFALRRGLGLDLKVVPGLITVVNEAQNAAPLLFRGVAKDLVNKHTQRP